MPSCRIVEVKASEVLDSRGFPTVEAQVVLENGSVGRAMVPSGASTGKYEATELRDEDDQRYFKKGVSKACHHVNTDISKLLKGQNVFCQERIDELMIKADGTKKKSHFGANAILAVSLAAAKAAAKANFEPLYRYVGGLRVGAMPIPMMNILNGGAHSDAPVDIQEFMIMPVKDTAFSERLRMGVEVYHTLKALLRKDGLSVSVGDEGGFAPNLSSHESCIEMLIKAIEKAGYAVGPDKDFMIALDIAASEWKTEKKGIYRMPKSKREYTSKDLILMWEKLVEKYPIASLEDPLDEEDYEGWQELTCRLKDKVMLVGDDLFVTNAEKLKEGIKKGMANAVLIKPNQIGSLTETLKTIRIAREAGYLPIMSHRSGETEDTTIADLAVALATPYIKMGAPARSERVAKYNRLLRIERELRGETDSV